LVAASAFVGAVTVVAPVLGPLAAGLAPPDRRGTVSGILLGGSIGGMLLSRTLGGFAGEAFGWRAPYVGAAALTLVSAAVLARVLPRTEPASRERYPALLAAPLRLLRTEPGLRRSCFFQAAIFGGFSAAWTGVALLLTGPAYGLTTRAVGLLALVNAATMFCTPLAGRLADRRGPDAVNRVSMLAVLASAPVLALGGLGGTAGLAALVAGFLVLDVAMQSGMVANQVRVYALSDSERSRLNTAYMTCAYLGGSLGSWLGAHAFARFGWGGVCGLVAVLAVLALGKAARSPAGSQKRVGSQGA
ncbi:MFS transporter, partial [Actinomadura harenae]